MFPADYTEASPHCPIGTSQITWHSLNMKTNSWSSFDNGKDIVFNNSSVSGIAGVMVGYCLLPMSGDAAKHKHKGMIGYPRVLW